MKSKPSFLNRLLTLPKRKKKDNEFSELASLLVQKEMRAKDAENTSIQIIEEYSKDALVKKYSEAASTVVYLENKVINLEYINEIAIEQLKKCCKRRTRKIKKVLKMYRKEQSK